MCFIYLAGLFDQLHSMLDSLTLYDCPHGSEVTLKNTGINDQYKTRSTRNHNIVQALCILLDVGCVMVMNDHYTYMYKRKKMQ